MTSKQTHRLDKIARGSFLLLDLNGHEFSALFIGIAGEGDDRRARFVSTHKGEDNRITGGDRDGFSTWEAYRYNGRWAFGASAERLSVVEVLA